MVGKRLVTGVYRFKGSFGKVGICQNRLELGHYAIIRWTAVSCKDWAGDNAPRFLLLMDTPPDPF